MADTGTTFIIGPAEPVKILNAVVGEINIGSAKRITGGTTVYILRVYVILWTEIANVVV